MRSEDQSSPVSPSKGQRTGITNFTFVLSLGALVAFAGPSDLPVGALENQSSEIDLSDFKPSFREDFDEFDVSEYDCLTRWTTHTPWDGDFGSARFMGPSDGFPFTTEDGILTIEARKNADGKWESGMLSSWNRCNSGFAQKLGYFETRARLPAAAGFWPAFWLIGADRRDGVVEVDIFEYYSHQDDEIYQVIHKHRATEDDEKITESRPHDVPAGSLTEEFHTYGAEITETEVIFYIDRKETWRVPSPPEFQQPMYLLVSFAAEDYRMNDQTPDSVKMEVDYIHAYQRRPVGSPHFKPHPK
ncbi:glycoside hydrolase family 16 protein [Erythrobacter rubeus]|uniref:Glycoside hydrolase family 16 protein n=1 Tax=Erythrobacter rubeus TaxID=2760803 RepID=A0ABR8KRD5_9SPHN|nr:glycoside hydrolase family 16 protein [Erythrobacter rubeus]MBD2841009.1 glycoside hydrolase family 16 protein [Erythrobacter rubeus]